ncbi:MAG: hypothetical protein IRZ16_24000 [Myxococcaceae bacterium]|nr:hypothetical protein [Myxococcaceae bacterium]
MRSLLAPVLAVALLGCPGKSPQPAPDAGEQVDAAVAPVACDSPEDCRRQNFDGVCRQGVCTADVPCFDDVECGLGETCEGGQCRFTGCITDDDCAVGTCRTDFYACTECSVNEDCPASNPVCTPNGHCVRCASDADCTYPGPQYCDEATGSCRHCIEDAHCPNGLKCGPGGICVGAQKGQSCSESVSCDLGLMCVNVGTVSQCLEACNLYTPDCPDNEICIKLTFQDSPSLVFDQGGPVGVCYPPINGLPGYHAPCANNCQPNLACVPDSATDSTCKAYCDVLAPFCAPGEICHALPGDYAGHEYGLCYPDNGVWDACTADRDCASGQNCVPRDDPSVFSGLSTACTFSHGPGPALAPCTSDSDCQSGACRNDPSQGPEAFFCFAACDEDADCSAAGRTGLCDTDHLFTTTYVLPPGQPVRGCRPACASPADCADYAPKGDPYVCLAIPNVKKAAWDQVCGQRRGDKLLGERCQSDSDCRDGLCLVRDGRGTTFREGVCSHPCEQPADCVPPPLADGGTAGVATACVPTATWFSSGPDNAPNTQDDVVGRGSLCTGGPCTADLDCAAPYSRCTADRNPVDPRGLITACRAPVAGGTLLAGDACTQDSQCASGVCAFVGMSSARTCLQPCDPSAPDCPGTTTCTPNGVRVVRPDGMFQTFDACVP